MAKISGTSHAIRTAVVFISLIAAGCGQTASQQNTVGGVVNVDPKVLLASISTAILQQPAQALAGWDWTSFLSNFGSLLTNIEYTVNMQKVSYQSTGADGQLHTFTGLVNSPEIDLRG